MIDQILKFLIRKHVVVPPPLRDCEQESLADTYRFIGKILEGRHPQHPKKAEVQNALYDVLRMAFINSEKFPNNIVELVDAMAQELMPAMTGGTNTGEER